MIAVYAIAVIKAGKATEFETVVRPLIAASLKDRGCLSYGCGKVSEKENTYTFIENWQSAADLELHTKQSHFIDAVAKLEDILAQPLEINVVDLF